MSRTRVLSNVLWSTLAIAGCGDDGVHHLADAPVQHDATAVGPEASYASSLALAATCGDIAPATVDLPIENTGTQALVVSAAVADGGFTVETTLPLTIAPHTTGSLAIRPPLAVIGTDLAASQKTGTLTLTTNAAAGSTVALAATVMGANLTVLDSGGAALPAIALAGASGACPAPIAAFIKNTGNLPITLAAASTAGFALGGFSGGAIAPGDSVTQSVGVDTQSACSGAAVLSYTVTGALCNGDGSGIALYEQVSYNITGSSSCFCS